MHRCAPLQSRINHYFGLRHGESEANRLGIIVSDPANGVDGYGLTDLGRQQVQQSMLSQHGLSADTITLCSDFRRARETAEIATEILGSPSAIIDTRLRERFFGASERGPNSAYGAIWQRDRIDPSHRDDDCESAESVRDRLISLVKSLESQYRDETLLLVSHGDPLQLLATAMTGRTPSQHRDIPAWETAELRMF
jgi:broad specificity phosphatase PhoE